VWKDKKYGKKTLYRTSKKHLALPGIRELVPQKQCEIVRLTLGDHVYMVSLAAQAIARRQEEEDKELDQIKIF
jgi:hypothetical protein